MHWKNVKLILMREVRDQLRDRRTLFMIAVLPLLLYPLLGMTFSQFTQFMREQATRVLLIGDYNMEGLPKLLVDEHRFSKDLFIDQSRSMLLEVDSEIPVKSGEDPPADPMKVGKRLVQSGEFEIVVYFPPDFRARLEKFRQELLVHRLNGDEPMPEVPSPVIYYNKAREKSQIAFARVSEVLDRWTELIGQENLKFSKVPPSTARPFVLTSSDVAEVGQTKAAMWSKVLPFVLLLWALTGAFYPAVDLCAGEKERGTLETLLSSPAERIEIVCGKLLTVMLFSIATAVLNLVSMGITGTMLVSQVMDLGPPPITAVVWLLIALVPVSALFSALCLALAAFARSTKEGQYYLMPLVLLTMPLVILPILPGVELNLGNSLIPITGLVLLLRQMLEGNYVAALPYLPVVTAVTLVCVYWAVRWAAEQFSTESVLFRESERFDVALWLKQLRRERGDTPSVSQAVFCGVLILTVRFFMSLAIPKEADLVTLAAVSQLAVIATPALLMTVMLTRSPAKTLLLNWPPQVGWARGLAALPMALALAVVFHPLADQLQRIVQWVYPINESLLAQLKKITEVGAERPVWVLLLVMAALPAICEELAFRGFILSGFRHLGHKWRAIVLSSIFFGVTHAIFQQSIVACLVGMMIGYIAVQTGTLFAGMLFHVVHNSLALLRAGFDPAWLQKYPILQNFVAVDTNDGLTFTWLTVAISIVGSALILFWFHRLPYTRSSEERLQEAIDTADTPEAEMSVTA